MLVAAENPVVVTDRVARTPAGLAGMIELAELLQASVIDRNGRMNFPTRHPLNMTEHAGPTIAQADVIAGLELTDFWGTVHSVRGQVYPEVRPDTKPGTKLISVTANDLFAKSNYQDFQRYQPVDLAIAADPEATLPSLIEAVKRQITDDRKRAFADRGAKIAAAHKQVMQAQRDAATAGWDGTPISTARLAMELWAQIKDEDWSFVSNCQFVSRWPLRLWDFNKHYQYIGAEGGYGVGYGAPASVGAALANRKHGRLTVSIQNDGDLMFAPGVLWTAAHHRIPILILMHNNRAYHQELMQIQIMASQHQRGIENAKIGNVLTDPPVDYAKLAATTRFVRRLVGAALARPAGRPRFDEAARAHADSVGTFLGLARALGATPTVRMLEGIGARIGPNGELQLSDWSTLVQLVSVLEQGLA